MKQAPPLEKEAVVTVLELPVPMAFNRVSRTGIVAHHQKRNYQQSCWMAAATQNRPQRDPPARVRIESHFRLYGPLRDPDGLWLKWVLDALRQRQTGSRAWRQGLYDECGYFIDDDPSHIELEKPSQVIDRKNIGLTLTLTVL